MIDFGQYKKLSVGGVELKKLAINGVEVWSSGYKNWVPEAIDTNGSIFNGGKGYIDGKRLGSSGSLSDQTNTVTTGFIPCKSTDVIRMAGVSWLSPKSGGYCYLMFHDSSFAVLGSINIYADAGSSTGYKAAYRGCIGLAGSVEQLPTIINGVTTFDHYIFRSDADKVAYFRVNGIGSGADMIVTVNEEIE